MWKWFCSFIIVVGAIIAMAVEQHHTREKYQAQSQADCIALSVSSEEKHSCAKEAQSRKDYSPWWYVLVAWPEGITTWAIIATGLVIAWQSNETRNAAQASWMSIRLQEAGMQQWIEVGNWKSESAVTARGKSVRITVEIANPTSFPLMISDGHIRLAIRKQRLGTSTWITGDYYLFPKTLLTAGFYFQFTDIEQDREFQNRRMHFDVEGSLSYVDALKNRKTQVVGGVLTCSPKRTYLTPSAGAMEPRDSVQPDRECGTENIDPPDPDEDAYQQRPNPN